MATVMQTTLKNAKDYATFITALKFKGRSKNALAILTVVGDYNMRDYREELEFAGYRIINSGVITYDLSKPIDMSLWMEG